MINLIYMSMTLLIVLVNLLALGVSTERIIPERNLARFSAVLFVILLFFFIEHFFGLGNIAWIWPFTTFIAASYLWKIRHRLATMKFWEPEFAFVAAFFYALLWRFLFPDINAASEELTDLYFISNYRLGGTLPPEDLWLSGFSVDFYYTFLHYAIALYGRIFDLSVGMNYNLAWPVIYGMLAGLAWSIGSALDLSKRYKAFISASVCLGGSGITVLSLAIWDFSSHRGFFTAGSATDYLWASVRAIGDFANRANTQFGERVFTHTSNAQIELPIETPAYLLFNGDLHAPLGGFLLLLFAVAGMLWHKRVSTQFKKSVMTALVVASVPLSIATNAWIFPLQGLLVLLWLVFLYLNKNLSLKSVILGCGISAGLLLPFLLYFFDSSLSLSVKPVSKDIATPLSALLQWWSLLFIIPMVVMLYRRMKIALVLVTTLFIAIGFTWFFYFDDFLGGSYERFNTTLKWWSWANMLLMIIISFGLTDKRLRLVSTLILLAFLSYFPFSLIYLTYGNHNNSGKLQGHSWFTSDASNRDLLKYLKALPRGLMLESVENGAYERSTRFSLFSEHPAFLGWYNHQQGWRGNLDAINNRVNNVKNLYDGKMSQTAALDFVTNNQIRYILWTPEDVQKRAAHWDTVNEQLSSKYEWVAFYDRGIHKVGVWQQFTKGFLKTSQDNGE